MNFNHYLIAQSSKATSAAKQPFDDILTCFICLQKLQSPHICPCCSKLCCYTCITKWLAEKQTCPHCRSILRLNQLVNCRFLEDIGNFVQQQDPCDAHPNQSLSYYCMTCSQPVCSDCAMFASHKQHDFERIQKVYDQKVKEIMGEVDHVNSGLKCLKDQGRKVDELVDQLNRAKDERVQEIQTYSEGLLSKLEQLHQQRLMVLYQQKQSFSGKIQGVTQAQEEVVWAVKNLQKSELISKADDMAKKIKSASLKENHQVMGVSLEFESEISPPYSTSDFVLKNYSSYRNKNEVIVYSLPLTLNGVPWRLKVYPFGNGNARNVYLSVFLEMGQRETGPRRYEYKVEMINQVQPNNSVIREFSSEFESGECWGYNRFFRIDLLEKDGYLTGEDKLVFKFYVRSPSFHSEYQDQLRYIKDLEKKLKVQEEHQSQQQQQQQQQQSKQDENISSKQNESMIQQEQKPEQIKEEVSQFKLEKQDLEKSESKSKSKGERNINQLLDSSYISAQENNEKIEEWILQKMQLDKKDYYEKSSIAKLKEEIEQYAEKIQQLEQNSEFENSENEEDVGQNESNTSSECYNGFDSQEIAEIVNQTEQLINTKNSYNGILEQIYAKNSSQIIAPKGEIPVRRNLIAKFEQEASKNFCSENFEQAYENDRQLDFQQTNLMKEQQPKQFQTSIARVRQQCLGVLTEMRNQSDNE